MQVNRKILKTAETALLNARKILITGHINPDADALGSVLALTIALRTLGKTVIPISADGVPEQLAFLPSSDSIINSTDEQQFDLAILCDLEALKRTGKSAEAIKRADKLMVIDHHQAWEKMGDIRIIDTRSSATCVIVYKLLLSMKIPIDKAIATCLMAGIITDTGSFKYPNTKPETFRIASKLMQLGADVVSINEEAYENRSLSALKLLGIALNELQTRRNGEIVWGKLSHQDFINQQATDEQTEGIVAVIRSLKGANVALLLREAVPGKIRISIRSREGIDSAQIAQMFAGGGHRQAAGCTITGTLEYAEKTILEAVEHWMDSSSLINPKG